jgi:hypothetical protein
MDKSLTWHFQRGERRFASYYLDKDYRPVAARIYAEGAPTSDFEVDILAEGVSIFADTVGASQSHGTTPGHENPASTYARLLPGENTETDADNFCTEDISGWLTLQVGSDGGASNVSVQLDLERVSEEDEE